MTARKLGVIASLPRGRGTSSRAIASPRSGATEVEPGAGLSGRIAADAPERHGADGVPAAREGGGGVEGLGEVGAGERSATRGREPREGPAAGVFLIREAVAVVVAAVAAAL